MHYTGMAAMRLTAHRLNVRTVALSVADRGGGGTAALWRAHHPRAGAAVARH